MLIRSAILSLAIASTAIAQHDHKHDHGAAQAAVPAPASFSECVANIRVEYARITAALKASNLDAAHDAGDRVGGLAKYLGPLALKDSAIPRDRVKGINLAGKDLVKASDDLHEAAHTKDAAKAAAAAANIGKLLETLGASAPQVWVCDMHCEGCKTYTAPGKCPVCKMDYKRLEEVGYGAAVTANSTVTPGKPADLVIKLLDPSGCPVQEVKTVHEYPLHFMVVSNDLAWYAHEHPTRQKDGTFAINTLSFPRAGKYTVFADFTPAAGRGAGKNQVAPVGFTIAGDAPPSDFKLADNSDSIGRIDDYEFRIRCNGQEFFAGQDSFLRYGIDKGGTSVADLEPLMGERGHLVIISADLKDYVHSHPLSLDHDHDHDHADHAHDHDGHDHDALLAKFNALPTGNGKPSDVIFHAVFPKPGLYRAFAQFKHKGRVLTIPFTLDVQKAEGTPDAPAKPDAHKGHDHDHGSGK